jgi:hypothetical protein
MWGNFPGWIISVLLLGAAGFGFYKLAVPPDEAQPAHLIPDDLLRNLALPGEADTIIAPGKRDIDAGSLYFRAIVQFKANPKPYDDAIHASPGELPALQFLREAADCRRMVLFETHPHQVVNYDSEQPELAALLKIADAADTIGLGALLDGKADVASQDFGDVFALGRHLFQERVTWREMSAGLGMMSDAAQNLAKLADHANDGARANVLRHLQEELNKYRSHLQETVASPLMNPVESYASKYSGDIFAIARDTSVERVWRVHAILHLGRYHWNVADGHRGDQVWARRVLRTLENSMDSSNGDPVIRTAIEAAENLTVEQQRKYTAM